MNGMNSTGSPRDVPQAVSCRADTIANRLEDLMRNLEETRLNLRGIHESLHGYSENNKACPAPPKSPAPTPISDRMG